MLAWSGIKKSNVLRSSQAYTCQVPEEMVLRVMGEDGDDANGVIMKKRKKYWGTWEELILGAAVLRLGTKDWNAVASLLQSKTPHLSLFTCEDCKAKYEELQQRYSGCNAWFEELRKRRVAELKNALAESETSIGSLESKIELLKAEKTCSNAADCSSNRADESESPLQFRIKSDANSEFSGKDVPNKDGLSAGSYTEETGPKWSSPYSICGDVLEDNKAGILPLMLEKKISGSGECFSHIDRLTDATRSEHYSTFVNRKKRTQNKRKRRIWNANQTGVVKNHLPSPEKVGVVKNHLPSPEKVGGNDDHVTQEMDMVKAGGSCSATGAVSVKQSGGIDNLAEVFRSILENDQASIFQRKMDSQKRARYKKVVRQHIDLEMIKSRITSKSVSTIRELLRDLLLLANNALVFYSKTTREYKCAMVLRDLVNRKLRWAGVKLSGLRHLVIDRHDVKPPGAQYDDKQPAAKHDDYLPAKPRNGCHPNKAQSSKAPVSTEAVPAFSTSLKKIVTKGPECTTSIDSRKGRETAASVEYSSVKVKRQKGRPPVQAKTDQASALAAVVADTTKFSNIKPRKRPRAVLLN